MRAALYARYSTKLQSERSVTDQFALCEKFISHAMPDCKVVARYDDRAKTGATVHLRNGLEKMLEAARNREFDVVIVESFSRISRNQGDLLKIHEALTFLGISLISVSEGGTPATTVQIGLSGLIGQLYRQQVADTVRRGMDGILRDGRHAGGRPYGYRAVDNSPGYIEVVPNEAEVIKSIFEKYVAGMTPRAIAYELNERGIMPPRGSRWNASTINGSKSRGNGILSNSTYTGKVIWGRVSMVRHPDTGKRISRPKPEAEWQVVDGIHEAIIDKSLFDKAQTIKSAKSQKHSSHSRSPKRLLSGLLRCGACGSGMSAAGRDKSGKTRIRCTRHIESGTCKAPRTYYVDDIERAVLEQVTKALNSPEVIKAALTEYKKELNALLKSGPQAQADLSKRAAALENELKRITDLMIAGMGHTETLHQRSEEKKKELKDVTEALTKMQVQPEPPMVNDEMVKHYLRTAEALAKIASPDATEPRAQVSASFRELVETVTIQPASQKDRPQLVIKGRLAALAQKTIPEPRNRSVGLVVAEEGLEPPTQGL